MSTEDMNSSNAGRLQWPIHCLVFDLDDTLIAERDYVASGFTVVGEHVERRCGVRGFAEVAMRLFRSGMRVRVFDQALSACGIQAGTDLVRELVEVYRSHSPKLVLLPDALDMLTWSQGKVGLAVISDGWFRSQQLKVEAVGLGEFVPTIILTDRWGRADWKPSRRAFEEVMRANPGMADGFLYVADNPRKDFIAPRALGWRTIRIRRPGAEHSHYLPKPEESAEIEITCLSALKALLTPVP